MLVACRDENMAYEALQKMLQSLQDQQVGAEEGRARLPQLLSSSKVLQDAGWPDARSRLMQRFSPAPLTDDPTWRLPPPQVLLLHAGINIMCIMPGASYMQHAFRLSMCCSRILVASVQVITTDAVVAETNPNALVQCMLQQMDVPSLPKLHCPK